MAAGTVLAVTVALMVLSRGGAEAPAPARGGRAPSGAWICPHGGGDGWRVSLFLANPGPADATARLTGLGERAPDPSSLVEVPSGETVRVAVPATDRGGASFVEYFGGWIGAGWVADSSARSEGIAAEPCAADAGRRWFVADGSTRQDEESFVVIANPFDAPAVLDVAIHSPERAPVRASDWTDLVVRPRRSVALRLDAKIEGETVAAVGVAVSVGRVAAASLVLQDETRIRSALGSTRTSTGAILPVIDGSGQAELIVFSVADGSIRFAATELSDEPPRPAGGLTAQDHAPLAAQAYAVPIDAGPTAIRVFVLDEGRAVGALRALGPGEDLAATDGAPTPASAWLVFPAADDGSGEPSLVLVNDGDGAVVATVEVLGAAGATTAAPITVDVAPHAAAAVPPAFLASAPDAALLVRAEGGGVVALSAATSPVARRGEGGAYALSLGVPVPQRP